jgi:hypothetical protein
MRAADAVSCNAGSSDKEQKEKGIAKNGRKVGNEEEKDSGILLVGNAKKILVLAVIDT